MHVVLTFGEPINTVKKVKLMISVPGCKTNLNLMPAVHVQAVCYSYKRQEFFLIQESQILDVGKFCLR